MIPFKKIKIHFVQKIILSLLSLSILCSCDDGDIIVTGFEFDEADLQLCRGSLESELVFFKINTQLNEAISFRFINDKYSDATVTEEPILIDLEADENFLMYRQFNQSIDASYYCSIVPDSDILVTNELVSTKGDAQIEVMILEKNDNDGVPALDNDPTVEPIEIEDLNGNGNPEDDDTDGDGIPNYVDQDDDNDNILTSAELPNGIAGDDSYRDSDEDGIPNYLDEDDDNDGILTINEDINGNGNPRDDDTDNDGIPNYLDADDDNDDTEEEDVMKKTIEENPDPNGDGNPDDAIDSDMDGIPDYLDADNPDQDEKPVSLPVKPSLKNTIETTYRTEVIIFGLEFNQNSEEFEEGFFDFGFRDVKRSVTTDPPN